jgi:hypothetical protein
VITAYSFASAGNEHYVLAPDWTEEGAIVARTLDALLDGLVHWPGTTYELRIDPRDVLDRGQYVLRVRGYEVVGVLPPERFLGRNAAQLDAFLRDLRTFEWLRPSGADRSARVLTLVSEHHAALGDYGRVPAARVRLVRAPHALCPLLPKLPKGRKVADREGLRAYGKAHETARRAALRSISDPLLKALARMISAATFPATWRAAWRHHSATTLEGTVAIARTKGVHLYHDRRGVEVLEMMGRVYEAGVEPSLTLAMNMTTNDAGGPWEQKCIAAVAAEMEAELQADALEGAGELVPIATENWWWSRRFSEGVSTHAVLHAVHLSGMRRPNPWAPWVELLRMGVWPVFHDGVELVVYDPQATGE